MRHFARWPSFVFDCKLTGNFTYAFLFFFFHSGSTPVLQCTPIQSMAHKRKRNQGGGQQQGQRVPEGTPRGPSSGGVDPLAQMLEDAAPAADFADDASEAGELVGLPPQQPRGPMQILDSSQLAALDDEALSDLLRQLRKRGHNAATALGFANSNRLNAYRNEVNRARSTLRARLAAVSPGASSPAWLKAGASVGSPRATAAPVATAATTATTATVPHPAAPVPRATVRISGLQRPWREAALLDTLRGFGPLREGTPLIVGPQKEFALAAFADAASAAAAREGLHGTAWPPVNGRVVSVELCAPHSGVAAHHAAEVLTTTAVIGAPAAGTSSSARAAVAAAGSPSVPAVVAAASSLLASSRPPITLRGVGALATAAAAVAAATSASKPPGGTGTAHPQTTDAPSTAAAAAAPPIWIRGGPAASAPPISIRGAAAAATAAAAAAAAAAVATTTTRLRGTHPSGVSAELNSSLTAVYSRAYTSAPVTDSGAGGDNTGGGGSGGGSSSGGGVRLPATSAVTPVGGGTSSGPRGVGALFSSSGRQGGSNYGGVTPAEAPGLAGRTGEDTTPFASRTIVVVRATDRGQSPYLGAAGRSSDDSDAAAAGPLGDEVYTTAASGPEGGDVVDGVGGASLDDLFIRTAAEPALYFLPVDAATAAQRRLRIPSELRNLSAEQEAQEAQQQLPEAYNLTGEEDVAEGDAAWVESGLPPASEVDAPGAASPSAFIDDPNISGFGTSPSGELPLEDAADPHYQPHTHHHHRRPHVPGSGGGSSGRPYHQHHHHQEESSTYPLQRGGQGGGGGRGQQQQQQRDGISMGGGEYRGSASGGGGGGRGRGGASGPEGWEQQQWRQPQQWGQQQLQQLQGGGRYPSQRHSAQSYPQAGGVGGEWGHGHQPDFFPQQAWGQQQQQQQQQHRDGQHHHSSNNPSSGEGHSRADGGRGSGQGRGGNWNRERY